MEQNETYWEHFQCAWSSGSVCCYLPSRLVTERFAMTEMICKDLQQNVVSHLGEPIQHWLSFSRGRIRSRRIKG